MKDDVWGYLKKLNLPIIIYGMGNGADKIICEFQKQNIKFVEVIASKSFIRGQTYRGYLVKTLEEIQKEYDNFIIVLAFATQIESVINDIYKLEKKYNIVAPFTPVYGDNVFNNEFYIKNYDKIIKSRSLLCDEKSKKVFDNYINYMLYGELKYVKESVTDKKEALKEVLQLNSKEYYVDLGAYKGDTIEELLKICGGYSVIYAFEPDKKNYKKLLEYNKNLPQVYKYNFGIWDKNDTLNFSASSGRSSRISNGISSRNSIEVVALDSILKNKKVTYIKMDIEGAEYEGLLGASYILKSQKPKLNIALYHRSEDIFKLPLLINSINSNYKMYLRHHPYIPFWDTNLYCV